MSGSSKKVIFAALISHALVALTTSVATAFTGSSARLSEGIRSPVDTGIRVLLFQRVFIEARPGDAQVG